MGHLEKGEYKEAKQQRAEHAAEKRQEFLEESKHSTLTMYSSKFGKSRKPDTETLEAEKETKKKSRGPGKGNCSIM